tara:strand:- start:151 stop:999 length:849 start_codon:yes stop_codon:yes gene_type:complete
MSELKILDGDAGAKYLGASGTGATGDPYFTIPALFELEIEKGNVFGHEIQQGAGKNPSIAAGPEDVWNGGGTFTGFPTGAAETMEIFSSDANDTSAGTGARTVLIKNLLDATGAEASDVTVTLNGTTPVSLGAGTYYRGGSQMQVLTAGSGEENAGTLTLRHTSTTANIFAVMPIAHNFTAILAYTVPLGKTLYINRVSIQMARASGAAGSAEITLRLRPHGTDTVFAAITSPQITDGHGYTFENDGWYSVPARTDLKVRVDSVSDTGTIVSGDYGGILIAD